MTGNLRIGYVTSRRVARGCNCAFQLPEDYAANRPRYVFVNDGESYALMNIDGQDMDLEFLSRQDPPSERIIREGDGSTEVYRTGRVSVRIDYTVTRLCQPGDRDCEKTWYDAVITLVRDGARRSIKVRGICGC